MTSLRCTVLAHNAMQGIASTIVSILADLEELDVHAAAMDSAHCETLERADGVIVVSEVRSFHQDLRQIADVRAKLPRCSVVAVGEALDGEQLASLFAAGAFDFITVPMSAAELRARVRRALGLIAGPNRASLRNAGDLRLRDLIGTSTVFAKEVAKLPTIASYDAGVLILGETGTGKEAYAQAIHYISARSSGPWVAVNCAAIPSDLIESELFGHVKGAYTTAHAARRGLISEAEKGTLLLDEIDSLSNAAQAKLLRFLQEKEYRPLGSNGVCHSDVRVIAASNASIADLACGRTLRRDLFFRLNVLNVHLPPLRERLDDIPALGRHFVERFACQFGRPIEGLAPAALRRLQGYHWPGNVREFRNVLERAVLLATGPVLGVDDLELEDQGRVAFAAEDSFRAAKARVVEHFERAYIENLLGHLEGNVTRAARAAQKNRRAFWELIRKHRIDPEHFR